MQSNVSKFIALYRNHNMFTVLCLGFVSGLPLPLVLSTLSVWLAKTGISNTSIGLLSAVSLPYAFKFLWSPAMDYFKAPLFFRKLGRRKGWLLLLQLSLALAIVKLGLADPLIDVKVTALWAFIVASISATQDIVIDAYRVEILTKEQQAAGSATSVFGYRVGMLASGAGALALAYYLAWEQVYFVMALLIGVGIITTIFAKEPTSIKDISIDSDIEHSLGRQLINTFWQPMQVLMQHPSWVALLLFILFYKLGDAFAGVMTNPFFVSLGFTTLQIGLIGKTFGFAAVVLGGVLGSLVVYRLGIFHALLVCGMLQMFSNGMFIVQALIGKNIEILAATVAIENISGGMGTSALVAFMSGLCNKRYTATHYAVLSSIAALGRTIFGMFSGWWVDHVGWVQFFGISMILALPGLMVLRHLMRDNNKKTIGI